MWTCCTSQSIQLSATHIADVNIKIADALSVSMRIRHTEWSRAQLSVSRLFMTLTIPIIDLFASAENNKLMTYCSLIAYSQTLWIDSLSISWRGIYGYVFPPISLIPRVREKIKSEVCQILLIAPWWPLRSWFQWILKLKIRDPLPFGKVILSQGKGK